VKIIHSANDGGTWEAKSLLICQSASTTADITISGVTPLSSLHTSNIEDWSACVSRQKRVTLDEILNGPHAEIFQSLRDSLNIIEPRQLLWHAINNTTVISTCDCGNTCSWAKTLRKYRLHCSNKCAALSRPARTIKTTKKSKNTQGEPWYKDPIKLNAALEKRRLNNLEKYGVEHHSQRPDVQAKTRQTNLEKYGVEHPSQSDPIAAKISQTFRNNHKEGTHNHNSLIARRKATSQERYGSDYAMQNSGIKKRQHDTMISRYGAAHALQSPELNQKRKDTNINRYGVSEALSAESVRNNIIETTREKYHCDNSSQSHFSQYTKSVLFDPDLFEKELTGKTLGQSCDKLGVSLRSILNYANIHQLRGIFADVKTTTIEYAIQKILDLLISPVGYQKNVRSVIPPNELDFFIADKNLAIEVHGLYWHCENSINNRPRQYHANKWKNCLDKNITLLQFTQLDIQNNVHLVESKIKRHLGVAVPVIGARKLHLKIMTDFNMEKEFLKTWHLQGSTSNRTLVISAEYNNETVGISTWKYHNNSAELVRFATNTNYSYPGLLSRMIKLFASHTGFTGELSSYSNNMYGTGKVYQACGFHPCGITPPGYSYTKNYSQLESRISYQKHKLFGKFNLDPLVYNEKSEWEIMQEMGYDRFWDAGHSRWIKGIT